MPLHRAKCINEKLNTKAQRIVSKHAANEMAQPPEMQIVRERMQTYPSIGPDIYKSRSRLMTYAALGVSIATMAMTPSHAYFCVLFALMYFYSDFMSGLLHVNLDNRSLLTVPFLREACLEFQWHHLIPSDIAERPLLDVLGDLNIVIVLRSLLLFASISLLSATSNNIPLSQRHYVTSFGVSVCMAFLNQYCHRQAHMPLKYRSRFVVWAQDRGLMLSPTLHRQHHLDVDSERFPHGTTFPVFHGRLSNVLQTLLEAFPHETFWFRVYAFFSIVDTVVIAHLAQKIACLAGFCATNNKL